MIKNVNVSMVVVLLMLVASNTHAQMLDGPIPAQVMRVIDGDTIQVKAFIWINQQIIVNVRLRGIDTPELSSRCHKEEVLAQKAKEYLSQLTHHNQQLYLYNISQDKYGGRVVASIKTEQGLDLTNLLLTKGYGRPYSGKKRQSWC